MYHNLGQLMSKFYKAPENISHFFELQVIRQRKKEEEEVEPIPLEL